MPSGASLVNAHICSNITSPNFHPIDNRIPPINIVHNISIVTSSLLFSHKRECFLCEQKERALVRAQTLMPNTAFNSSPLNFNCFLNFLLSKIPLINLNILIAPFIKEDVFYTKISVSNLTQDPEELTVSIIVSISAAWNIHLSF